MVLYYAVSVLLSTLLSILAFSLAAVLLFPGTALTARDRWLAAPILTLLAVPLAIEFRSLRKRIREMQANFVICDGEGVRLRLAGEFRNSKGLPDIPETRLSWSEITSVKSERRKFTYRSLVPFAYPLDVYSIVTPAATYSFTKECFPRAHAIAEKIRQRAGAL